MTIDIATGRGAYPFEPIISDDLHIPTTDRRGGRSLKQPPDAPAGDGSDTESDATEGDQEEFGQNIVDEAADALRSGEGIDDLTDALSGKPRDERSSEESRAAAAALEEILESEALDIEVISVEKGEPSSTTTDEGTIVNTTLDDGEKSRVIEVLDGSKVLVISDELSDEDILEETTTTIVEVLEDIAISHGLDANLDMLRNRIYIIFSQINVSHGHVFVERKLANNLIIDKIGRGFLDPVERLKLPQSDTI